ncbi:uncharacterized protein LOC135842227 isoform X1 [Planococcus citri]|uniref:uncharacterized protein LOC135842227 isoform X1 n=1 Tax=Planococcus citri TaxID=170843 RepID=UPI0031F7D659
MALLRAIPSLQIPGWPESDESTMWFYLSPCTLREMAAVKMALLLWHRRFSDYSLRHITSAKWIHAHKSFSTKDMFVIHPIIESQIDQYIDVVSSELENWLDYHLEKVFFDSDLHEVISKCYGEIVCCGIDCSISWHDTAKALLKSDRLTQMEKYRIACLYCLKNDIKRLWPLFWKKHHKGVYNSILKPIVMYWNDLMLDEVRTGMPKMPNVAVEKRLISSSSKYVRNWATVLYFLKRFSSFECTDQVISLIEYDVSYAIHLVPELNDDQVRKVMIKRGVAIWYHFAKQSRYVRCALRVWSYIRHLISESEFYSMISLLMYSKAAEVREEGQQKIREHTSTVLFEMWNTAPPHLRKFVVDNYAAKVLDIMYDYKSEMLRIVNRDARFLLALLSDTDFHFRNDLWLRNWSSMIFSIPPLYLDQLMIVCLEDPEKISKCKKDIVNGPQYIQKYCFLSIKEGCFEDIDDFLTVCSLPAEKKLEHKKELLRSFRYNGHLVFELKTLKKWKAFSHYVDRVYQDDEFVKSYKKDMVFSSSVRDALNKELISGRLWYVDRFISTFITTEDSVELKAKLMDRCQSNLAQGKFYNFDRSNWQEFFEWCSVGNEQKISEFRSNLPIDRIFLVALKKSVKFVSMNDFFRKWADDCDFVKLDSFLKWFFGTAEGVKCFKLKKVYVYQGVDDLKAKLNVECDDVVGIVLKWFFDGNSTDLEEWKKFSEDPQLANLSSKR